MKTSKSASGFRMSGSVCPFGVFLSVFKGSEDVTPIIYDLKFSENQHSFREKIISSKRTQRGDETFGI